MKRFVSEDDNIDEEASKNHKSRESNKRPKKKISKHGLGSKGRNLDASADDKDLEKRVKELEKMVKEMRKKFAIDLNILRSSVDILRNQVI